MSLDEKKEKVQVDAEASTTSVDHSYNEEYVEPSQEESLHRGLKARQISMIAVRGLLGHKHDCLFDNVPFLFFGRWVALLAQVSSSVLVRLCGMVVP